MQNLFKHTQRLVKIPADSENSSHGANSQTQNSLSGRWKPLEAAQTSRGGEIPGAGHKPLSQPILAAVANLSLRSVSCHS